MADDKKFFQLTEAEIKQRAALTPEEQLAVDIFMAAAAGLPETLCLAVIDRPEVMDDPAECEPNLIVRKRVTKGFVVPVAQMHKLSLSF